VDVRERRIRDARRVAKEVAEGKAIIRFTFELRIRKAIPLLKDEEFDHEDDIIVRPTAFPLGIRVQIQKEGAEGIPVDQGRNFTRGVPTFSDTGILVP